MIGLREDQRVKERLVTFLNNAAAPCMSWLASDGGGPVNASQTDTPLSLASRIVAPQLLQGTAVGFRPGVGSQASKGAG